MLLTIEGGGGRYTDTSFRKGFCLLLLGCPEGPGANVAKAPKPSAESRSF